MYSSEDFERLFIRYKGKIYLVCLQTSAIFNFDNFFTEKITMDNRDEGKLMPSA